MLCLNKLLLIVVLMAMYGFMYTVCEDADGNLKMCICCCWEEPNAVCRAAGTRWIV